MVKIHYLLSKAGQKASLLSGGNGRDTQVIEVAANAPEYPLAVALASVGCDGSADIHCDDPAPAPRDCYSGHAIKPIKYDAPPTISELLKDEADRREQFRLEEQQRALEEKDEREREINAILASPPSDLVEECHVGWRIKHTGFADEPRLQSHFEQARVIVESRKEEYDRIQKQAAVDEQLRVDRIESERLEWIDANGSDRLKRCIAEGIPANGIYLSERMAKDYPGWIEYSKHAGVTKDAINPTMEAFLMLDEARLVCPDAKLMWAPQYKRYCAEAYFHHTREPFIINYFGKDVTVESLEIVSDDNA